MKIELLTETREEEYHHLLLKDDRALFSSSLAFKQLLKGITGSDDYYFIAVEDGKAIGALPAFLKLNDKYGNALNSLPWYGSNPGITVDPSYPYQEKIRIWLLQAFHELAEDKKAVTSTIITRPFDKYEKLYSEHTEYSFLDSRVGMITPLPVFSDNIDSDLMAIIHSKTRNMIRKAQTGNIRFWHDSNTESLRFLADVHRQNMEAVGAPSKGLDFFNLLSKIFTYDKDYRIYIAELDGVKIAALLVTYFSKTIDYFTPVIVADYRNYQPLSLLIFNAMKDGAERGFRYWNWGGTTLPSQTGVYHFKKKWGSEECIYYYYIRSYADISKLLSQSKETLLKEYPHFYVLPFSELRDKDKEAKT